MDVKIWQAGVPFISQVSEIGSQFPGKSYLPYSSNETGAAVSQILCVAPLMAMQYHYNQIAAKSELLESGRL